MKSYEQLNVFLEDKAKKNNTAFISPMLIILLYIHAEKEGECTLKLEATKKMLPYFFAAGHHNYARCATNYLNDMYDLPEEIRNKFQKGLHVARLSDGYFNGLWSDMLIETTLMRFGSSPGGLIGMTLQPNSVIRWEYSFHFSQAFTNDQEFEGAQRTFS